MESLGQPAGTLGGRIGRFFGRGLGNRHPGGIPPGGPATGREPDSIEARMCVALAAVSALFVLVVWRGLEPSSTDLVAVSLPSATPAEIRGIASELKATAVAHEVRFGILYVRAEDAPRVVQQFRAGHRSAGSGVAGDPPAAATEPPGSY